jgi:hypothetical protein
MQHLYLDFNALQREHIAVSRGYSSKVLTADAKGTIGIELCRLGFNQLVSPPCLCLTAALG